MSGPGDDREERHTVGAAPAPRRGDAWRIAALFAAALVPRLAYGLGTRDLSYFADFYFDAEWFRQRAVETLAGHPLSAASHFRAPLYSWFLAAVFRAFGETPDAVRSIQLLLGAANGVLFWSVARRLVSPAGALLAGFLYAGYGMLVFFDGEILTLTLETTLLLLLLRALLARPEPAAFRAGLLLGLSAVLRPTVLPLALPVLAALSPRRAPRAAGAFLLALALPVAPVVLGYRVLLGDWIPISSQGGINFYLGNHAGADGSAAVTPCTDDVDIAVSDRYRDTVEECSRRVAEAHLGRSLRPSEVSRYWFGRGLAFLRERPGEFAHVLLKRAYLLVSSQELDNNQDIPYFLAEHARWILWMPVGAGVIFALGLPGLVGHARRGRDARVVLAAWAVLAAGTVTFLVMSRYRVPLLILLLPYAGESLVEIARMARDRRWRPAERRLVVALLLVVFSSAGLHRAGSRTVRASQHFTLGFAEERAGADRAAAAAYRRSIGFDPSFGQSRYALGNALVRLGEGAAARREYEQLLAGHPRYAPFVANSLGILAANEGDVDGAIAAFRRALAGDPSPLTRANLAQALLTAGRGPEALAVIDAAAADAPPAGEFGVDIADARFATGDSVRAERDLAALVAREPSLARGWLLLAEVRRARGDAAGEAEALRGALRADPRLVDARRRRAELGAAP
jgi:tetratricopeptide (TPR) repeat protein